ncbi:MAG: hypothetical protein ACYDBQ_07315 [Thermoplasmatota archaeon]
MTGPARYLLALAALLVALAPAHAATLQVRADPVVHIEGHGQPHVGCEFWVQGSGLAASGTLHFFAAPLSGPLRGVFNATWTGSSFLVGPFHLPPGHAQVNASGGLGQTFWVDPCLAISVPCPAQVMAEAEGGGGVRLDFTPANLSAALVSQLAAQAEAALAPAPANGSAGGASNATATGGANGTADASGNGTAAPGNSTSVANATATGGTAANATATASGLGGVANATQRAELVYRAEGRGAFALVAVLPASATSYVDSNLTAGVTASYLVTTAVGVRESAGCSATVLTTIPDFPTPWAVGAATLGAAGLYAWRRR